MDHIETKILNSYTIQEAAQNMVFAARLTQQGHSIQNMDDLMALYQKSFTDKTVDRIASLPHPTVQKFTVITVAIVGASRRFLAQITRHQNEVKFMSASLQYSNYSEKAAFTIPYEVSAKYCYAAHESRLHQNDRCKRFALCLVLTVRFRSLAPWGKLFQLFI